ncbi:MAG: hypothetical protein AAF577_17655 [Pseudomonadota bacterium]
MSYLGGTGQFGAVMYDDKFLYSHHGTDPAGDTLCNAWDLVRIHKFCDKDFKIPDDEDVRELPSQKAIAEFANKLRPVMSELMTENLDLEAMFDDLEDDVDPIYDERKDDPDDEEEDLLGVVEETSQTDDEDRWAWLYRPTCGCLLGVEVLSGVGAERSLRSCVRPVVRCPSGS